MAKYLRQLFPGVQMTGGRLEIQSDAPIIGTVLTDSSGQLSSLPLLPAVKAYTFSATVLGSILTGELSLWIDGLSVQGYLRTLASNGVPPPSVTTLNLGGSLAGEALQWYTSAPAGQEGLLSFGIIKPFRATKATQQGPVWLYNNLNQSMLGQGQITLTAVN